MPEPTYCLPVTLLGSKSRGGLFIDNVPADVRAVLIVQAHRYESVDGNGETISLWPHPEMMYEKHRATVASIAHCFWPWELADTSEAGRLHFLVHLQSEIARSRARIEANHWTANHPEHFALVQCYRTETTLLLGPTRYDVE